MAAIITDKLKNLVVDLIKANDSDASNKYYAAIGRSEAWNDSDVSPTPLRTKSEENCSKKKKKKKNNKKQNNNRKKTNRIINKKNIET